MNEQASRRSSKSECRVPIGKDACGRPEAEMGICEKHLAGLEARLLARLLPQTCRSKTEGDRICAGDLAGLCETHREKIERKVLRKSIHAQLSAPISGKPLESVIQERTPCGSTEEARARLQAILDRRRFIPNPNEAYTIPFESLRFERRKAYGPSLVDGDEDVALWFFEKSPESGEIVVSYGNRGTRAGKDMPLASRRLFVEMMELLKFLPGYTETCEITANPIRQPLGTLAYKLLRGLLSLDEVRFVRFSQEAPAELRAGEARKQMAGGRRLVRLSPVEIAAALVGQGVPKRRVLGALDRLLTGFPTKDVEMIVAATFERRAPSEAGSRRPEHTRRSLSGSPLLRYGHAVMRRNSVEGTLEPTAPGDLGVE